MPADFLRLRRLLERLHTSLTGVTANQHHTPPGDGDLAPKAHKLTHQDGGADEISVAGLLGETAELTTHKADVANPHQVTAAQAVADPAGSAAAVQGNLDTH
ncbi:unnamed protein product, partial [marine sediment metagenome]